MRVKSNALQKFSVPDDSVNNYARLSCACVLRGIPTSMHLDLGWGFELAIEALEKVNYDVDNLEQRFRDTLVDTFSEGRPDAEIAASVLEWDCVRADRALDALHDALTRDSSEESTTASAETNATPARPCFVASETN